MPHPFTPTYIAMVKAAKEIQSIQTKLYYESGEWCCSGQKDEYIECAYEDDRGPTGRQGSFWLPRLDQLLGILENPDGISSPEWFITRAASWESDEDEITLGLSDKYFRITDWHELALAVVMFDKYGKTWMDGVWQKNSQSLRSSRKEKSSP